MAISGGCERDLPLPPRDIPAALIHHGLTGRSIPAHADQRTRRKGDGKEMDAIRTNANEPSARPVAEGAASRAHVQEQQ